MDIKVKFKILTVGRNDAFYVWKDNYVGKVCKLTSNELSLNSELKDYIENLTTTFGEIEPYLGPAELDFEDGISLYFYEVVLQPVVEETILVEENMK